MNVRHPWFDDWKGYLGVEPRCLVPLTRFAEPLKLEEGRGGNAPGKEPLTFLADLWTEWEGTRPCSGFSSIAAGAGRRRGTRAAESRSRPLPVLMIAAHRAGRRSTAALRTLAPPGWLNLHRSA